MKGKENSYANDNRDLKIEISKLDGLKQRGDILTVQSTNRFAIKKKVGR